jgi:hypothetical protein
MVSGSFGSLRSLRMTARTDNSNGNSNGNGNGNGKSKSKDESWLG